MLCLCPSYCMGFCIELLKYNNQPCNITVQNVSFLICPSIFMTYNVQLQSQLTMLIIRYFIFCMTCCQSPTLHSPINPCSGNDAGWLHQDCPVNDVYTSWSICNTSLNMKLKGIISMYYFRQTKWTKMHPDTVTAN